MSKLVVDAELFQDMMRCHGCAVRDKCDNDIYTMDKCVDLFIKHGKAVPLTEAQERADEDGGCKMKEPFGFYMRMKAKSESAYNLYNYASVKLENAQIMERLAEIESQHEPLASLRKSEASEREKLVAAAYYVVHGRMPEQMKEGHAHE